MIDTTIEIEIGLQFETKHKISLTLRKRKQINRF